MFLVNGMRAKLKQYNRHDNDDVFDDTNFKEIYITCCPYNADLQIVFSEDTIRQATGYYQIPNHYDVRVGDQIKFLGYENSKYNKYQTIIDVKEEWYFNRIENFIVAVR